jgi:hypothetical protein
VNELSRRSLVAVCMTVLTALPLPRARAFTQSGAGTGLDKGNLFPMGHEWITRLAAFEVLPGGDPVIPADPNDPRKKWTGTAGKAKNVDVSSPEAKAEIERIKQTRVQDARYESVYGAIFDAIIGQRWVDVAGYNVVNSKISAVFGNYNCFDLVAQEPAELQYDHFMRRYDDAGGAGGVHAAEQSRQRFIKYFVAAAMAPPGRMLVWDGGGYSTLTEVDRNYFLFGRAVHLFEDSFSSEHTVRLEDDRYETIHQVKSYLCATASEQHTHKVPSTIDFSSGDVIWLKGTNFDSGIKGYLTSSMKTNTLVATEGMRDVWAAFIRTMGTPAPRRAAVAQREAEQLAANWLKSDPKMATWYDDDHKRRDPTYVRPSGDSGPGQTQAACVSGIKSAWEGDQRKAVAELEKGQRVCLFNVDPVPGYSDLNDSGMRMPYNWKWRNLLKWEMPGDDWKIPERPADSGRRMTLRVWEDNAKYLTARDGLQNGSMLVVGPKDKALIMTAVRSGEVFYLRATSAPTLFVSYEAASLRNAKLYGGSLIEPATKDADYSITGTSDDKWTVGRILKEGWFDLFTHPLNTEHVRLTLFHWQVVPPKDHYWRVEFLTWP